jgi:hypothetical protein
MKLPVRVTLAVALASGVLLLLDSQIVIDLSAVHAKTQTIVVIVWVASSVFSLGGIVNLLLAQFSERRKQSLFEGRRAGRKRQKKHEEAQAQARTLKHLDHLSPDELKYVVDCLRNETPTFHTYNESPAVDALQRNGLVWSSGAKNHSDHFSFSFYDFAWEALLARKDEFITRYGANHRSL